ncbi:MAG: 50S ribosomal protein L11 methyltransferase [Eubacterium sp.]|nr:50S ribosomal protein L11 methyltransferase [Eubacterium sp.]
MKYIEITTILSGAAIEPLTAALAADGIEQTEVTDPADIAEIMEKKESFEWDYINDQVLKEMEELPHLTCYFPYDEDGAALADRAVRIIASVKKSAENGEYGENVDFGPMTVSRSIRDDSDWKDKWKEYFKPFRASEHIVVKPSWENYEAHPGDLVIEIDPGMAFGTGTHETTSMCIEMLDKYIVPGTKVLDLGCGSGILTIAASLLGADEVLGVDIDREAVRVSVENIGLNGVSGNCRAEYGDITKGINYTADLIAGNLMAELVAMLAPDVFAHLAEGGLFITSGILTEKKDMVSEALEKAGFVIEEVMTKGEWVCIAARKEAS